MVVEDEDEDVRGAKTQSLYRDVNERVNSLNVSFSLLLPLGDWICECADTACDERIAMTLAEYESVRASGVRFVVAPRHVYPNIERVIERTDSYWVVEKYGGAGELAARFDPRAHLSADPRQQDSAST